MTIANLEYGYNWRDEVWDIYQPGEEPLATAATEEVAALFASAPRMAAEIERLKAERAVLLEACKVALNTINLNDETVTARRALVAAIAIAKAGE